MNSVNNISYKKYHRDSDYISNENLFKNIFMMRFKLISRFSVKKGKVLDIGCSNGVFLDIFKDRGWQTFGVEPSESGVVAQKRGHAITRAFFEKSSFPKNCFDLVLMNHTLEHVKDADVVLQKIYSVLKKGGILFIDVPNAGGLGSRILKNKWPYRLPKEHTYQFTKESLSEKITGAGFKIVFWESRSGLFEFDDPIGEIFQSLAGFKKRFFSNLINLPYSALVTLMNSGDSMSFIAKKI